MAKLWTKMMAIFTLFIAHLTARGRFMSYLTGIFVALKIALMTTFKYLLTFVQTQSLSSTSSCDILFSASSSHNHPFSTLALSVVARVLTLMTTGKLFVANIVALRDKSSANNRWLQEGCSAGTRLGLTVNNRTFLA